MQDLVAWTSGCPAPSEPWQGPCNFVIATITCRCVQPLHLRFNQSTSPHLFACESLCLSELGGPPDGEICCSSYPVNSRMAAGMWPDRTSFTRLGHSCRRSVRQRRACWAAIWPSFSAALTRSSCACVPCKRTPGFGCPCIYPSSTT